ncbi:RNA-directed DNA polymerase from mobile element jockey-like [Plakobranchus ocellatus]|uniref:RNA-directed DNA polymerase from mobile element jockey-like n=1 Tax=Plakobranchus ocellatus TaxID=259542 RepID=A0AAV3XVJ8_9GAST|nr:RNA-directed DNA polymerase from mobile element jockey-like [Plakobranchus ocellatus]
MKLSAYTIAFIPLTNDELVVSCFHFRQHAAGLISAEWESLLKIKRTKFKFLTKKEKKEKKKRKERGEKEEKEARRPFDRDLDLQVNKFDDAQRKLIIQRSQALNSRFQSGGSTSSFL